MNTFNQHDIIYPQFSLNDDIAVNKHAKCCWLHQANDLVSRIYYKAIDCGMIGNSYPQYPYLGQQADYEELSTLVSTQPFTGQLIERTSTLFIEIFMEVLDQFKHISDKKNLTHFIFRRLIATFDTVSFKRRLKEMYALHEINTSSLLCYVNDLRAAYRKLMVIRLDLYADWAMYDPRNLPECWEAMLKRIRNQYPSFAGYVLKFEFGQDRGVHLHTLLFLNGSEVRQDVVIARALGELWISIPPQGVGSYHNANAHHYKSRMQNIAVGIIYGESDSFDAGMYAIASYMAKSDPIVLLALPQLHRTIRHGALNGEQKLKMARRKNLASIPASIFLRHP